MISWKNDCFPKKCLTTFNTNGSMRKLQRASCFSCFQDPLFEVPSVYIILVDMGLIWRLASKSFDDCDAKTRSEIDYL